MAIDKKTAQWWNDYDKNQRNQQNLDNIFDPNAPATFGVSGSPNEIAGRIEGLQRAKTLTGMDPFQIGQEYQNAFGNIKKRTKLSDTGSELLRANKAGAVADARNQLLNQGVKGGAALGAVSAVERAKSYDVNNQLQDAQRKAEADYLSAVKGSINFTQASEMGFGNLAAGKDAQMPAQQSNGFGSVICTELYRKGYYSLEIYAADQAYGLKVIRERNHVYIGYRVWADPVVRLMKKSDKFTKVVAFFAVPWAKNMAGQKNIFGATLSFVFEPICGLIGKFISIGDSYANRKKA